MTFLQEALLKYLHTSICTRKLCDDFLRCFFTGVEYIRLMPKEHVQNSYLFSVICELFYFVVGAVTVVGVVDSNESD